MPTTRNMSNTAPRLKAMEKQDPNRIPLMTVSGPMVPVCGLRPVSGKICNNLPIAHLIGRRWPTSLAEAGHSQKY